MTERKLVRSKYIVHDLANSRDTPPKVIENGGVVIEDGWITEVGKDFSNSDFDTVEDLGNQVVLPGLVNTHSHAGMTLFRGYADDLTLYDWLSNYIWPIEAITTAEDVRIGAKLAAIEALMSGTTTFNSMYWNAREEAQSFKEIGVRLLCGPGILTGIAELDIGEASNLISELHGKEDDMTRISMNPHAPYTVSSEDYQKITEFVKDQNQKNPDSPDIAVHTHLHEVKDEMTQIKNFAAREGFSIPVDVSTPTEYLSSIGVLHDNLFVAHAVGCNSSDIQLLKQAGSGVSINTVSNMKLGNSFAPVTEYYDNGVKMGIGTDSATSNNNLDMFEEMKTTAIVQKGFREDPIRPRAWEILKVATAYGAESMSWNTVGDIAPGRRADLISIDLNRPHLCPITSHQSLLSHIVYAAQGQDVMNTMVNGEWKMRDRKIAGLDLESFLDEFEGVATDLYARALEK